MAPNKKVILVIQSIREEGMRLMESRDDVDVRVLDSSDEDAIIAAIPEAHGITVRVAKITRKVIEAAPNLQVVSRHGVGYDAVDVATCTERGIPVVIATRSNAASVTEQAMSLLLALAKRTIEYDRETRIGNWRIRENQKAFDIESKRLLIVGYGRIGSRVARAAQGFGMNVSVYDPYVAAATIEAAGCAVVTDFKAALPETDVLTLHCPKTPETANIVDAAALAAMPKGALIINCARGGLIDETALHDALVSGHIGGAGLDVFDTEPAAADHPLFGLDAAIVSPHSAGASLHASMRAAEQCVQNVLDTLDGKLDPGVVVNKEVLDR